MNGMNTLGIKQDTFRQRSLTGVDMGTDADISHFVQIFFHHTFLNRRFQALVLRLRS